MIRFIRLVIWTFTSFYPTGLGMFYPSGALFFRNSSGGFCYHFGFLNVLDPLPVFGRLWIVFGRQMGERELIWLPPLPIACATLFGDPYEAKGLDLADSWADCVPADAVSQKSRNVTGKAPFS